jgi:hypothetical protein
VPKQNLLYPDLVSYGRARRKGLPAGTEWARALWRVMERKRISQGALARMLDASPAAVCRWLQGANPPEPVVGRFRALFPGELSRDVPTETARRRTKALENVAKMNAAPEKVRSARARRGGRAGAGKPKTRTVWRASADKDAQDRQRLAQEIGPGLLAYNSTPHGRSQLALGKFLDHNPGASLDRVRLHACAVAERLGLTFDEVWAGWKGPLVRRGYRVGSGRPRLNERRAKVEVEMAKAERRPSGQLPGGWWGDMAEKLQMQRSQGESLRQWYVRQ